MFLKWGWILFLLVTPLGATEIDIPEWGVGVGPFNYRGSILLGRGKYFDTIREIQKDQEIFNVLHTCVKSEGESTMHLRKQNEQLLNIIERLIDK